MTHQFYRRSTPRQLLVLNHDISRCWGPSLVAVVAVVAVVDFAVAVDNYIFVAVNARARLVPLAVNALAFCTPSTSVASFNAPVPVALNARVRLVPVALNVLALVAPPGALGANVAVAVNTRSLLQCSSPRRRQRQRTPSTTPVHALRALRPVASINAPVPVTLNTPTPPASMPTLPSRSTPGPLSPLALNLHTPVTPNAPHPHQS
ncbi:hypothetical protein OF83DRAFT_1180161 [Amylostereum chailletii]|nr:hypothetical protein OF83DRAFT_1180161 [Amylostereum chailletii]